LKKGEQGIRILALIAGIRRKKDEDGEGGMTRQKASVLFGFRSAYVFDV
jgi:hypothetical protein